MSAPLRGSGSGSIRAVDGDSASELSDDAILRRSRKRLPQTPAGPGDPRKTADEKPCSRQ